MLRGRVVLTEHAQQPLWMMEGEMREEFDDQRGREGKRGEMMVQIVVTPPARDELHLPHR